MSLTDQHTGVIKKDHVDGVVDLLADVNGAPKYRLACCDATGQTMVLLGTFLEVA